MNEREAADFEWRHACVEHGVTACNVCTNDSNPRPGRDNPGDASKCWVGRQRTSHRTRARAPHLEWSVHEIAWCCDCTWKSQARNAKGLAGRHARETYHKVMGERGLAFRFDRTEPPGVA